MYLVKVSEPLKHLYTYIQVTLRVYKSGMHMSRHVAYNNYLYRYNTIYIVEWHSVKVVSFMRKA